jgi:hypothetical protein
MELSKEQTDAITRLNETGVGIGIWENYFQKKWRLSFNFEH